MVIVELIQILAKNNLMTYQMNSPIVFAYESDSYHRIFLELSIIEDRTVQISQIIKVYIKRKSSTENENILQPSPQVINNMDSLTKMTHKKSQENFNRKKAKKFELLKGKSYEALMLTHCTKRVVQDWTNSNLSMTYFF